MLIEGQPFIDAQDELSVTEFMRKYGMPERINEEVFIAMAKALENLNAKSKDEALKNQEEALATVEEFGAILEVWSVELAQMALGVSADVSDASDRVGVCEQLDTSQANVQLQTEEAAR